MCCDAVGVGVGVIGCAWKYLCCDAVGVGAGVCIYILVCEYTCAVVVHTCAVLYLFRCRCMRVCMSVLVLW